MKVGGVFQLDQLTRAWTTEGMTTSSGQDAGARSLLSEADGYACMQECHIDVKEDQLAKLMVAEGFVHGAEVIMRAETFKRCLLHVSALSFSVHLL